MAHGKPESDALKAQRKLVNDLAAEYERAQQVVRIAGQKLQTAQDKLTEMQKNEK